MFEKQEVTQQLCDMLTKWILNTLGVLTQIGSTIVETEHQKERQNVCYTRNNGNPCEHLTEVSPLPGLNVDGCGVCKCPILTLSAIWDKYREENKIGEPLTAIEIYQSVKRKNTDGLIKDRITCKKKFWQEIDENYKNNYELK